MGVVDIIIGVRNIYRRKVGELNIGAALAINVLLNIIFCLTNVAGKLL